MASSSGTKDEMGPPRSLSRRMTRSTTTVTPHVEENASADSEQVPSSLSSIAPILRVANEIERENRRVAYLCMTSLPLFTFNFHILYMIIFPSFITRNY